MDLLKELCTVDGISGFEKNAAEIMKRELNRFCDKVEVDSFGNVIGQKGFISFVKIGGIDDRILLSQRVVIKAKKGDVNGVIGSKPPHLQKKEETEKVMKSEDLFIDIGASNREEAGKKVEVGDPIIFEPAYYKFTDDIIQTKAIDDRLGCYILIKLMERLPKNIDATIYAVGTCQEEVGLKGARVAAFKIDPQYAFAIDTTIAGDTPQIKENESILKIGGGPAITIAEACGRGLISHPKIREHLIATAKKYKIPYQIDVVEGGMTDGAMIYMTREGIPTGVLSIPCRYIHSPTGVFSMKDVDASVELLAKAIIEFKP